jgi:hypothetical protein
LKFVDESTVQSVFSLTDTPKKCTLQNET